MVVGLVAFFIAYLLTTHKQVVSRWVEKHLLPIYKPSNHLVVTYFSYLCTYLQDLLLTDWVTKVKPDMNSVEVIHK
jgi:hypothetical protein